MGREGCGKAEELGCGEKTLLNVPELSLLLRGERDQDCGRGMLDPSSWNNVSAPGQSDPPAKMIQPWVAVLRWHRRAAPASSKYSADNEFQSPSERPVSSWSKDFRVRRVLVGLECGVDRAGGGRATLGAEAGAM